MHRTSVVVIGAGAPAVLGRTGPGSRAGADRRAPCRGQDPARRQRAGPGDQGHQGHGVRFWPAGLTCRRQVRLGRCGCRAGRGAWAPGAPSATARAVARASAARFRNDQVVAAAARCTIGLPGPAPGHAARAKHQAGGRQPQPVPDGLLDLVLAWPGVHRDDVLLAAEEHEDHRPEASVDQCSVSHPHRSTRFARSGSTACPIRTPLPGIVLPVL